MHTTLFMFSLLNFVQALRVPKGVSFLFQKLWFSLGILISTMNVANESQIKRLLQLRTWND